MEDEIRLLRDESLYEGFNRLRRVHFRFRRYDGRWSGELDREILDRPNGMALLPYDPVNDRVVLIRQFRAGAYLAGVGGWHWEPIGGLIAQDEDALSALAREAMEEAGCRVRAVEWIGDFMPNPGVASEIFKTFCGWVDTSSVGGVHGSASEEEDILVQVLDFPTVQEMLARGQFQYLITALCVSWLVANRARLRPLWRDAAGESVISC